MANTKISALTANTNPNWSEEFVYAYNNGNGKITLNTMKTYANTGQQAALVSGVNIKTINNTSILWSGNIDVSWWWGGGFEPTELSGDANIWELSEWAYVTTHDLYYKTWEALPTFLWAGAVKKRMLFVVSDSNNNKWYLALSATSRSWVYDTYSWFWYSFSSSSWAFYQAADRAWSINRFRSMLGSSLDHPDALTEATISQVIDNIDDWWTNTLRFSNTYPAYTWVTYTIIVNSVASWQTYSIGLGNWVTNPLNIALPTNSNKTCVITVLATSTTTGIVTSCTMWN